MRRLGTDGASRLTIHCTTGEFLRRLIVLVLVFLLTACSAAPSQSRDPALVAAIDSLVHLWLAADPTGISIAVVHRGDTMAMRGYGLATVDHAIPVTDSTVFHIGSVTKPFTAAAVMKLVEEDRLRLDTTVQEVLPEYSGPGGSVTIHQLLNHTSGIPSYTVLDRQHGSGPIRNDGGRYAARRERL
jgi:D-alanyl-D-alanine carboxypeptidase